MWKSNLLVLKSEKGITEIGIVITSFFIVILLVLPLNLVIQELALLNNVSNSVQIASELTLIDMVEAINVDVLSEGKIYYGQHTINTVDKLLKDKISLTTGFVIEPINISFELLAGQSPNKIKLSFEYLYTSMILLKGKLEKEMVVTLFYELPLNR